MGHEPSFTLMHILGLAGILVGLVGVVATYALEGAKGDKPMDTAFLGGVTALTVEELTAMQQGQYILHARGGKLTKVPVEKSLLPHDPKGHVQMEQTALGPDGAIYVNQGSIMCKSTDGGRTWTSYERAWPGGEGTGVFKILSEGTFITVTGSGESSDPLAVWASSDDGRTWRQISQIELPGQYNARYTYGLFRLPDDTLLFGIGARSYRFDEEWNWVSGKTTLLVFRSTDKGKSWQSPSSICDWGHEGGIVQTASGKLLATIRYERPLLPSDPPDLVEKTKKAGIHSDFGGLGKCPYRHVFLADSEDEGRSWDNFRQLTTVHSQVYGYPAALSDGTVVVIHDCRYGPTPSSPGPDPRRFDQGRAMISYDEGQTWENEVYYMFYGAAVSGYSQSVVLEDDVILTIAGTSDYEPCKASWTGCLGHSDLTAIRWKPTREAGG